MSKLFLENRNFRTFVLYQTFNGIGYGIFSMFIMWAVHAQYQSTLYTGIAGVMASLPYVVSFTAGPFIDKRGKIALMRITCFARLCIVGTLVAATFAGIQVGAWFFFPAILLFGVTAMLSGPSGTAFLPTIIDGDDLMKANASINIFAVITGLAVGVFLYRAMAGGVDFLQIYVVNAAVLAIAVLFSILLKGPKAQVAKTAGKYFDELKIGFGYVRHGVVGHLIIVFMALTIFWDMAYVGLPMFAEVHAGAATGYILLAFIAMLGSVIGSYIVGRAGSKYRLSTIIIMGLMLAGALRILFVFMVGFDFHLALVVYALYVGMTGVAGLTFYSFRQKLLPKEALGRASTVTTSLYSVTAVLGSLLGGFLGNVLPDIQMVFIIHGVSYLAIALGACMSKKIRGLPKLSEVEPMQEPSQEGTA